MAESGLSPRGGGACYQQRGGTGEGPREGGGGGGGLKYVQLLDEGTRRERWMHTTWHHLPHYRLVNPVTNWSSHYVRPHKLPHRHFVIHPDWPPE